MCSVCGGSMWWKSVVGVLGGSGVGVCCGSMIGVCRVCGRGVWWEC